ncbi:NHLP-related RiPP peptide [Kribbella antibiotica]|nr:NHLP-related RiPP peptide [Kribbella antibiotica]
MQSTVQDSKLRIPHEVVDRLLELLATDDAFRELFRQDRHAALIQAGWELPEEQLRANSSLDCLTVNRLASKETIAGARAELRAHLLTEAAYNNPHRLDAGAMHAVLRHN